MSVAYDPQQAKKVGEDRNEMHQISGHHAAFGTAARTVAARDGRRVMMNIGGRIKRSPIRISMKPPRRLSSLCLLASDARASTGV